MDEIMTECKLNLALAGVLVYIPGGGGRREPKSRSNVNQICLQPLFWFIFPAAKAADG